MSDFAYVPSYPAERGGNFNVRKAQFGDGYAQSAADGINAHAQEWRLTFENITTTTGKAIADFLEGKGGHTTFTWTPPSPWNSEIRVICEQPPTWRFTGPNCGTLVCVFTQRFFP